MTALGSKPSFAARQRPSAERPTALGSKPTSESFCQLTALSVKQSLDAPHQIASIDLTAQLQIDQKRSFASENQPTTFTRSWHASALMVNRTPNGSNADKPDLRFPSWDGSAGSFVIVRSTLIFFAVQRKKRTFPCPAAKSGTGTTAVRTLLPFAQDSGRLNLVLV